jgi:ketosteroid isomerase-like protein
VVKEFTEAMNDHDVEKALAFLTDDIVFEMSDAKITRKEQVKAMLEFDAVNNAHITNTDIKVEGNLVTDFSRWFDRKNKTRGLSGKQKVVNGKTDFLCSVGQ